jgi:eukaryotic-like serine/threonine-protein kinase
VTTNSPRLTVRPGRREETLAVGPGSVIDGKYRIEAPIGEGGSGRVFRATHLALDSPIAVKFVAGWIDGGDRLERFRAEARIAASVRHRHVVTITDFGVADGEPYMAMELLEGCSLDERLTDGLVTPAEAVDITCQLLAGLDAVHRAGIVHGDVKPANVFLTPDPDGAFARLLDFGVSRAAHGDLAPDMLIVGTPQYMSPEQAVGARLDARSDLYSAGVLLYEMLAGQVPFDDPDPVTVVERVAFETPPRLATIVPSLGRLAEIVDRAMSTSPDGRYASAREMRRALLDTMGVDASGRVTIRFAPPRTAPATAERPTVDMAPPKRRSRGLVALGIAGALLVAAATAVAWYALVPDHAEPPPAALPTPAIPTPPSARRLTDEPAASIDGPPPAPTREAPMVAEVPDTERETTRRADPRRTAREQPAEMTTMSNGLVRELDF